METSVHRTSFQRSFVAFSNEVARSQTISIEAKGLLLFVLSHPPDWIFRSDWIRANCAKGGMSRAKYQRVTRELITEGYLRRNQQHINGRWQWSYEWFDTPQIQELKNDALVQEIENEPLVQELKNDTIIQRQILRTKTELNSGSSSYSVAHAEIEKSKQKPKAKTAYKSDPYYVIWYEAIKESLVPEQKHFETAITRIANCFTAQHDGAAQFAEKEHLLIGCEDQYTIAELRQLLGIAKE